MVDSRRLRRYVVRIDAVDGSGPRGTGFFVAPGLVLTAAHVVDGVKQVHVQPDPFISAAPIEAVVEARSLSAAEAGVSWPPFPDLAVLRLNGDLDHPCVLLQNFIPAGGVMQHAWGYPRRGDAGADPVGEPATFVFEGVDRDGFLQLAQGLVRLGLSGAPLVCPTRGAVIGVITATRDLIIPTGGWATPIGALLTGGPGVPDDLAAIGRQIAWWNSAAWLEDRAGWDRVVRGDDPIPEEITLRRAHRLGVEFAFLTLLEAGPPTAERLQAIQERKSACQDICDDLSIPFFWDSPQHERRVDVIASRIQQADQLQSLITHRLGGNVAAAFRVSFDLGVSPEMIPFLPADQRADSIRRIEALATQAGLPVEIVDRVTAFLVAATDSAMLSGAIELNEELSKWWFTRLEVHDPWLFGAYLTIWRFARNAALAAITKSHRAAPTVVASLLAKSRRFGDDMDLVPPPLSDLTGNRAADHAKALHYLLDELPAPLATRLENSYGPGSLQVLRMCTRLWTLPVIYHPDDGLGQTVASIIEEACRALGIPESIYGELVRAIRSRSDFDTVKDLVFRFDHAVAEFFSNPANRQRCGACTWRCTVCGATRTDAD